MVFELQTSIIDGSVGIVPVHGGDAWDLFEMLETCFPESFIVACYAGYENGVQSV